MSPSRKTKPARFGGKIDPVDRHVGQRLRHLRHLAGLSQTAIAESVGITFQQIQKYESGANRLSGSRMWHLARVLDAQPSAFFEGLADDRPPGPPALSREAVAVARHFDAIALPEVRQTILRTFKILAAARPAYAAPEVTPWST